jgi:polygalacturonase
MRKCAQLFRVLVFGSVAYWLLTNNPQSAIKLGPAAVVQNNAYNVRGFGAKGDGKTLDTGAINNAIQAAAQAGGGTVQFPAGDYLSVSIHLKSNITLYLDQGAVIIAADPKEGFKYDAPESNPWDKYQDFGHSHWQNSLIWGENLENVSILGPGLIWGKGLVRSGPQSRLSAQNEALRNVTIDRTVAPFGFPNQRDRVESGWSNKAIALKLCRNITIRDISILHGGHFAILATGVDNLTIDNVKIDTNRDGIDIDSCRNVRISNSSVNSPFDDGICPKSSYALGYSRATENLTISNCFVSGYDEGSLLNGTFKRELTNDVREFRSERGPYNPTGRIKFGTESNGGFRNITVSNCAFDYASGLALESVDGGVLEDVTINNIIMRDVADSPLFLRLGSRGRGPKETTKAGALRRISISNVMVYNADPRYGSIISGIPGHPIEDVRVGNIRIYYKGGGTRAQAAFVPPEKEGAYPEPEMFGKDMPAYGFFIRHVRGIEMNDVQVSYLKEERRSPFVLSDVWDAAFYGLRAQHAMNVPTFVLRDVSTFSVQRSWPFADKQIKRIRQGKL